MARKPVADLDKQVITTVSVETHQKLRIKCALKDVKINEFVRDLIEKAVK